MSNTAMFVDHIMRGAATSDQRTGQYLFNQLPTAIASVVGRRMFDPFHKNLSRQEVYEWIESHLIFEGNEIIGVFDGDNLLWEFPPTTPTN